MNAADHPLCIDLDGTLLAGDSLHEGLVAMLKQHPLRSLALPLVLLKGKAAFKHRVAEVVGVDPAVLPYRHDVLEWLLEQRAAGRKLVLATAADRNVAQAVAEHLGLFEEVISSGGGLAGGGEGKRAALRERFGERGYDYAGNDAVDVPVWQSARQAVVVGDSRIAALAAQVTTVERVFPVASGGLKSWLQAMRLHQWVKNALVLLPLLLAHRLRDVEALRASALAFLSFGLCASSVYIVNDVFDLPSDRRHPRKRRRPFAAGKLSPLAGLAVAALLLTGAALIAAEVTLDYCLVLAGYYVLTWAYTIKLKRAALVDVMTLAGLYTLRIIAGGAATGIPLSFWLLAFSVFIFVSLGFVKRYAELYDAAKAGKATAHGRGYRGDDLPLLLALGVAAGYCTVVVVALYINSSDSIALYRHHKPLWLICPLLMYWISRVWLLTARGHMHDDPVVFAIKDRISLVTLALLVAVVLISA